MELAALSMRPNWQHAVPRFVLQAVQTQQPCCAARTRSHPNAFCGIMIVDRKKTTKPVGRGFGEPQVRCMRMLCGISLEQRLPILTAPTPVARREVSFVEMHERAHFLAACRKASSIRSANFCSQWFCSGSSIASSGFLGSLNDWYLPSPVLS